MTEFVAGYIYGSTSLRQLPARGAHAKEVIAEYVRRGIRGVRWRTEGTDLRHYGGRLRVFNFERFLREKIAALPPDEKLRVLDVGIGLGKQWVSFLSDPTVRNRIEFHATSLLKPRLDSISRFVKICHAGILHGKFQAGYFDVIVSHLGMHEQEHVGIENAVHLLKPGGEAILTFEYNSAVPLNFQDPRFFDVIDESHAPLLSGFIVHSIRLRKHTEGRKT